MYTNLENNVLLLRPEFPYHYYLAKKSPLYKIIRREIKKVTSCLTSREQLSYEVCDPSVFHEIITRSDIC